jgi:hypothetical protein
MRAQGDADRFAGADADRNPEMIYVRRDAIDFGGESDGCSCYVNEVPVVQTKVGSRRPMFRMMQA